MNGSLAWKPCSTWNPLISSPVAACPKAYRPSFTERSRVTPRDYGIRVIVDTAGEPLHRAFGKGVYLMKPNLRELELFAGGKLMHQAQIKTVAGRLIAEGLSEIIVVSMGAAGAALVTADEYRRLRAPIVKVRSKVGAGDSMVAGLVMGLAQGRSLLDTLRLGHRGG